MQDYSQSFKMIYSDLATYIAKSSMPHAIRFAILFKLKSQRKLKQPVGSSSKREKKREGNRVHDRSAALHNVDRLRDNEFKRLYRLDRVTFSQVLEKISPLLEKNSAMASRNVKGSRGSVISPKMMLLSTLRFMAGGIYLDICMSMNIGFGSFFGRNGLLWRTMEALDESYEIGLPLNDEAEMEKIASEFSAIAPGRCLFENNSL